MKIKEINLTLGRRLSDNNYGDFRVEISVNATLEKETFDEAYKKLYNKINKKLTKELKKIKSKLEEN